MPQRRLDLAERWDEGGAYGERDAEGVGVAGGDLGVGLQVVDERGAMRQRVSNGARAGTAAKFEQGGLQADLVVAGQGVEAEIGDGVQLFVIGGAKRFLEGGDLIVDLVERGLPIGQQGADAPWREALVVGHQVRNGGGGARDGDAEDAADPVVVLWIWVHA